MIYDRHLWEHLWAQSHAQYQIQYIHEAYIARRLCNAVTYGAVPTLTTELL